MTHSQMSTIISVPKGDLERKNLVGIWEEIWTETTPGANRIKAKIGHKNYNCVSLFSGTTGGLRLYLSDIKSLCAAILKENPTWALKAEAGRALAKAAAEAGDSLSEEQASEFVRHLMIQKKLDYLVLGDLLDILKESLSGRTWTGKENLLFGIENICDHCRYCAYIFCF